jgi:hypothetical protein
MSDIRLSLLDKLDLDALVLDECQVSRGDAEDATPGKVESEIDVSFTYQGNVVYTVSSQHRFMNADGTLVVTIDATFAASYSYDGPDPEDDELREYAQTALMIQVLPFIREFLASMTNRLGLPPFYLPLFGKRGTILGQLQVTAAESDDVMAP